MQEQHFTNGEDESQKGVTAVVLSIVICALVILGVILCAYTVVQDRMNGIDAYRNKELREQRDGYKNSCEDNFMRLQILQEWAKQQPVKPSPELLAQKNCTQPQSVETTTQLTRQ